MTARFPLSPPAYTGPAGGSDGCFFTIVQLPEPAVMRYCLPDDAGGRQPVRMGEGLSIGGIKKCP